MTLVSLSLEFINPPGGTAGEMSQEESAYIRPHFLNPGMTDDVGTYTCHLAAIITISNSIGIFGNVSEVLQMLSKLYAITVILICFSFSSSSPAHSHLSL